MGNVKMVNRIFGEDFEERTHSSLSVYGQGYTHG